ncbi:hypothetical protein [Bradyrhizobium sp. 21]|uniref:hypothetical protein n=1 Tax=Bradyrhizobium sp. 21 TaxID=2782666 RepID=UPI001FF7374C|nr:hypothetical protein [Bradyrhizobium sp. 21]MCK1384788.1 hypothetical protein [Bradyrhizobium sp. 21]
MDVIAGLIVSTLELVVWLLWWAIFDALPAVFWFTALALLFAATLGKVTVEFPERRTRIGWTGLLQVKRPGEGKVILSPALGVIAGFVIWAVIVSAVIIVHAYQS